MALVDVEDPRVIAYWELLGARQALSELARKYWDDLPGHVRRAVKRALNDINDELAMLEEALVRLLPDREVIAMGAPEDGRHDGAVAVGAKG